jgi:sugar transferase (PEP-CTERM system associated)
VVRIFSHYFSKTALLQMVAEAGFVFAVVLFGMMLKQPVPGIGNIHFLGPALLFAAFMTAIISAAGLYRRNQTYTFSRAAVRFIVAFVIGFPIMYALFHWMQFEPAVLDSLAANNMFALSGILVLRAATSKSSLNDWFSHQVMVVGAGPEAAAVGHALKQAAHGEMKLVGYYPTNHDDVTVPAKDLLRNNGSIVDTAKHFRVKEIIVALRERRGDSSALNELLSCKLSGVRVIEQSTFYERITGEVRVDSLRASWLIYGDGFRQGWMRNFVKRTFDIISSVVLLVATLPVMSMAAIAIRLTSAGPIFYRQERVGQNGGTFNVMKFRSMCTDAEASGVPQWAKANDARVTAIGRIMRRTRIDELPQIFNVLRGDMSFVGPRPERPFFVDRLTKEISFYAARHSVKPGITGWAQVNYKYGSSAQDALRKLQFDLYYVKNHTLFLDLLVLLKTVKVVLSGEGAH